MCHGHDVPAASIQLISAVTNEYMYVCVIKIHQFLTMFHNFKSCVFGNEMDESMGQG
jgi:hypothetical protein